MADVFEFPRPNHFEENGLRQIRSFADFVPSDGGLDNRAQELLPEALKTLDTFPAQVVAEMLAYAAGRLERVGFAMFTSGRKRGI